MLIGGFVGRFVLAGAGEGGERTAQRHGLPVCGKECHAEVGRPIMVPVTVLHVRQLARYAFRLTLTQPVVTTTGRIGRIGLAEVVVTVQRHVQPLQHFESLFVSQLRHQRIGRGVACTIHPVHSGGILGLFILVTSHEA